SEEILLTPEMRLHPQHTALLVIDMQNDFCAKGGYIEKVAGRDASQCRAVAAPISRLGAEARALNVLVIWVVADYSFDKVPAGMAAKYRARGDAVCCAPQSWGGAFFEVEPKRGEAIVTKHCYSGFADTGLDEMLKSRGMKTVVLAGV